MHGKLNSAMWSMKTLINHLLEEQKKNKLSYRSKTTQHVVDVYIPRYGT